MESNSSILSAEGINKLIEKGNQVLKTQSRKTGLSNEYLVVEDSIFSSWRTQVLNYVKTGLGEKNHYYIGLKAELSHGAYPLYVKTGISHLKALIEDIESGLFLKQNSPKQPLILLSGLFDRFHNVAVQLRSRHQDRETLDIKDEYDVQDLLHALLMLDFNDIEPEDWISKFAGTASRIDFSLRDHQIVVETKMTRPNLKNKQTADELIIDIERYSKNPNCKCLVCFVYDPNGYIKNPIGFENDFNNKERAGCNVVVVVRPKR